MKLISGTVLDFVCICIGTIVGCWKGAWTLEKREPQMRFIIGIGCIFGGVWMAWAGGGDSISEFFFNLLIAMVGFILGRLVGRLMNLQRLSNSLAGYARRGLESASVTEARWAIGFKTAVILYCISPLSVFGAVANGMCGWILPLLFKSVMDGVASVSFGRIFGWTNMAAAFPLLAWQGAISVAAAAIGIGVGAPILEAVCVLCGLFLCISGVVLLGLQRVELANYIPAILITPVLRAFFD